MNHAGERVFQMRLPIKCLLLPLQVGREDTNIEKRLESARARSWGWGVLCLREEVSKCRSGNDLKCMRNQRENRN